MITRHVVPAVMLAALLVGAPGAPAWGDTASFTPEADATIRSDRPSKNFGTRDSLDGKGDPLRSALVQFRVDGTAGQTIASARLVLRVTNRSADGGTVRQADPSVAWTERSVTWNTAPPALGPVLGDPAKVLVGQQVEVDVTEAVTGDGEVAFRLDSPHRNKVSYASREAGGAAAPTLIVTFSGTGGGGGDPTAPSDLEGVALGATRVELHWRPGTAPGGVVGHRIERDGQLLATVGPDRRYADTTASPSTRHVYEVTTVGASGDRSDPATVAVTTLGGDGGVLVGAGDIATCGDPGHAATADLLDDFGGTVFTTGDNVYDDGTAAEFANCYDPTWGRHRARTLPVAGNHEYGTPRAAGYFDYFGAAAGRPGEGWYATDVAGWRVYALNSNCGKVGGCDVGSDQYEWFVADLQAHPRQCSVVLWHHPSVSSGDHGRSGRMDDAWTAFRAAGGDIVLVGHDHDYERFVPLDDRQRPGDGPVEFVVGTGGGRLDVVGAPVTGSAAIHDDSPGVLALVLGADGYTWEFVPTSRTTAFVDTGHRTCR